MGFIHRDFKKAFDEVPLFPHGVEVPLAFSLFLCTVHLNVYFSIIREQNSMKIDRHVKWRIVSIQRYEEVREHFSSVWKVSAVEVVSFWCKLFCPF